MTFTGLLELTRRVLLLRVHEGRATVSQLATAAGLAQCSLSNILIGKRQLNAHVADRLLAASGLDLYDLFIDQARPPVDIARKQPHLVKPARMRRSQLPPAA